MRYCKSLLVGMAIMVMVGLGGCCGGGSTTVKEQPINTTTTTTTLGEELKSLRDAYDRGIITEKEYNASKEKIIKQRTATDSK